MGSFVTVEQLLFIYFMFYELDQACENTWTKYLVDIPTFKLLKQVYNSLTYLIKEEDGTMFYCLKKWAEGVQNLKNK